MADYVDKLKKEYPGMFGPVGAAPMVASYEFAPRKISASLHSTGEDPHADYDVEEEAWKETIRDDPSGIGVMPSPLDSDWKKFRDGRIFPILDMPIVRPDEMTDDEIDELIEDELDLSKDDPLLSGYIRPRPGTYDDSPIGGIGRVAAGSGLGYDGEGGIIPYTGDLAGAKAAYTASLGPKEPTSSYAWEMAKKTGHKWLEDAAAGDIRHHPHTAILPPESILPEGMRLPYTYADKEFAGPYSKALERLMSEGYSDEGVRISKALDEVLPTLDERLDVPDVRTYTGDPDLPLVGPLGGLSPTSDDSPSLIADILAAREGKASGEYAERIAEADKILETEGTPWVAPISPTHPLDSLFEHDLAVATGKKTIVAGDHAKSETSRIIEDADYSREDIAEALRATGHTMTPEEFLEDHFMKSEATFGDSYIADTMKAGKKAASEVVDFFRGDPPSGTEVTDKAREILADFKWKSSLPTTLLGIDADSSLPTVGTDPYPGMVDPTFEPTATTHYDDILKHFETEAVPGHLPMDITDIPPYSAIMGEPYKYDPVMLSSSDYSRPDMELDPATRALIDYDMDVARATLGDPGYIDPYPGVDDFSSMSLGTGLDEATKAKIDADMASGMFTEVAGKGPIPGKIYDARDFITDFGPLTASTHGEEPWRGLTTADFATDATFRPSGLAKYGLGAGSLGAGLMTTATPISPSSYIEGEIDSPRIPAAHHGPVWPITTEMPIDATGAPIEVDDFSSMSVPSAVPSYMARDAAGVWHDTRSFGYMPPGYDWRTGTFPGGEPTGGRSSASMSDDDKLAAALERLASLPPGSVGGPPITWTHTDATGGPLTPFGGVGDIGGGSGTVTTPLTGGGFYVPITPHIPIGGSPPSPDPYAGLWT